MRFLRGLGGRVLDCGCLVGIYETYDGSTVATIDALGPDCHEAGHLLHSRLPLLRRADEAIADAADDDHTASHGS